MEPYYYRGGDRFLGQGTFGKVFVMRNVSDGKEYAAKQYFCNFDWDEADKLQKLRNVGIYSLQRFADFFSLQERIVEFIGIPDEDIPMLIMGYRSERDLAK